MIPAPSPCVVLDTNVCLDLFVFRDVHSAPILHALQNASLRAVTRADCRAEWQYVLHYPHLRLDDAARKQAEAEFDQYIACIEVPRLATRLPVCSDRDDQKFLELACDAQVQSLITKDRALLKLARKTANLGLFSILLPQAWGKLHIA